MLYVVLGICVGVIFAASRVPKTQWGTSIVGIVLLVLTLFGFQEMKLISFGESLLLLASTIISTSLYAGVLWKQENLDPSVTVWGWAWRDFIRPSFARDIYKQQNTDTDKKDQINL
ncbi:hypothetical protein [Acaricomes phytoseiuli]|uniref:hypothetical protein n=1 Tax=Acaricomes phytoseiuli TaxID=291968 RepID=UPI00036031D7|nr:hypothetical protein [Acaricomes phytoseiuli]